MVNHTNSLKKQALRKAIRSHPGYGDWRQENGSYFNLSLAGLEDAFETIYGRRFDDTIDTSRFLEARNTDNDDDQGDDLPLPNSDGVLSDDEDEDEELERVARMLSEIRQNRKNRLSEQRVIELIEKHSGAPATINLKIDGPAGKIEIDDAVAHYALPAMIAAVSAGVNLMLVGPAGSGKTTAAEQCAKALGLDFAFTGALSSEYKLSGFIDAQGRIVSTAFRRVYENGGVFLFDEVDGSLPGPVLAFNAALANGHADFPDGRVERHSDFRAIAAANTFGRGADRQYVGRNQLDAATLDRFAVLYWDYDEGMESAIVGLAKPGDAPTPIRIKPISDETNKKQIAEDWTAKVRQVRRKVADQSIRHVVSPRATINGIKLLIAGWPKKLVEDAVLYKGLDSDTLHKIKV